MPKPFMDCVSAGGRVRTKELGGGKYVHLCFLKGKSYAGEVKVRAKSKSPEMGRAMMGRKGM